MPSSATRSMTALNPSRQARLHRRLAHGLEAARARVPGCTDPAEIVAQYARSTALPGAEAGIAAAIEAADLAQAAGAHEAAVAFLTTAADLARPDDERLTTVRSRLGLALAWALRFDEAVTAARDAAERIAHGRRPRRRGLSRRGHRGAGRGGQQRPRLATGAGWPGLRRFRARRGVGRADPAGPGPQGSGRPRPRRPAPASAQAAAGTGRLVPVVPHRLAQRGPRPVRGRGHLPAAGQRARRGGRDPTVRLYLLGALRSAAAGLRGSGGRRPGPAASWRGRSTAGRASPAPGPP